MARTCSRQLFRCRSLGSQSQMVSERLSQGPLQAAAPKKRLRQSGSANFFRKRDVDAGVAVSAVGLGFTGLQTERIRYAAPEFEAPSAAGATWTRAKVAVHLGTIAIGPRENARSARVVLAAVPCGAGGSDLGGGVRAARPREHQDDRESAFRKARRTKTGTISLR